MTTTSSAASRVFRESRDAHCRLRASHRRVGPEVRSSAGPAISARSIPQSTVFTHPYSQGENGKRPAGRQSDGKAETGGCHSPSDWIMLSSPCKDAHDDRDAGRNQPDQKAQDQGAVWVKAAKEPQEPQSWG